MMLRPELVEAAAKAICARRNDAWAKFGWNCDAWEAITEVSREQYREDARAALGEMQREMNRVVAAVLPKHSHKWEQGAANTEYTPYTCYGCGQRARTYHADLDHQLDGD